MSRAETTESIYHRLRRLRHMASSAIDQRPADSYAQGLRDGLDMAILEMMKIVEPT